MALLALFRRGMSERLRKLTLGFILLGGALGGMPMRPEEIEELLNKMNETTIFVLAEREDDQN